MPAQARTGAGRSPIGGANGSSPADDQTGGRASDPSAGTLEAVQVRAMFDRIAGVYDLLNSVMTAGLHHRWRERASDLARVGPGSRVLDVATGTGDLAVELARRVSPGGEVVASAFSEAMLERARCKPKPAGADLRFEWGDALDLPFEDGAFDAATVGFGARNFSDLARGLAEMVRVVRPDRKSTRLNSSHLGISYAVFCLKNSNDIGYILADLGLCLGMLLTRLQQACG